MLLCWQSFFKQKEKHEVKSSEIAEIPPAELNEVLSEFILNVRTKEGKDYEPSTVRENASFGRSENNGLRHEP